MINGGDSMHHADVVVIAALPEELAAARDAALESSSEGMGIARWEQRSQNDLPYLWGEYRVQGSVRFAVALARPTHMGGRTTGTFAATIVDRLGPAAVAMCGVCAGSPEETALGDVVIGEPVYEWDEGKHSPSGFRGEHRQFPMNVRWVRAAQDFDPTALPSYGDATEEEALMWFLEQMDRGREPRHHPAVKRYFPSGTWGARLGRLEAEGLIMRESNGMSVLTAAGADRVQQWLYDDVDGPQRLPFRVLVAPMASGSSVIADPRQWDELKAMGIRKIGAIEMEAATIATIAQAKGLPWVVAKGVMDHADTKKDDRYKQFAARASAQVLFALLGQLMCGRDAGSRYGDRIVEREPAPVTLGRVAEPRARVSGSAQENVASQSDILASGISSPDATIRVPSDRQRSVERENAIRSAREYLKIGAFSRKRLIEQLSSDVGEGYSLDAATYAVDSLGIDFNEQAVRSAREYLKTGAFSRKRLIEQLSSDVGEGYSLDAATYAVDSLGIDFNEQAVRSAREYLKTGAFSRKRLIEQLSSDVGEGFTHSQAVHGANELGL
ncbi:Ltp family lipoprotein [Micromonospora sp. SCSIO 07396]